MNLLRIYTDADGQTHFDEIDWRLREGEFSPLCPAGYSISDALSASEIRVLRIPAGYVDAWHPVPDRMLFTLLNGRLCVEVSDGEQRIIETGQQFLCHDTSGKGHRMRELHDRQYDLSVVVLG